MNKDELIAKQQLEIEDYKQQLQDNFKIKHDLKMRFYGMGQPLNDNIFQFNKRQLTWCVNTIELVESINTIKP